MKQREGFVSNSSSCSFILVLPEDRKVLEHKRQFWDWFGLKEITSDEAESLRRAVLETLEERPEKESLSLLIRCVGDLIGSEGWVLYHAKESKNPSYAMENYEKLCSEIESILELIKTDCNRLLFMEVGNSCGYASTHISNDVLAEDLSIEDRAVKIMTKNCFIFNNH